MTNSGLTLLTADIEKRVVADFGTANYAEAVGILQRLADKLPEDNLRVLRCVVFLAKGDLSLLTHNADRALSDWRDVIYWAEYDEQDRKIQDFNLPFQIPET